jgi:Ca-activated chloride channel family protein
MQQIQFGNFKNIYFFIVPLLVTIFIWIGIGKKNKILSLLSLKKRTGKIFMGAISFIIGSIFIVIALLSPQKLEEEEKIWVEGNNIYFLIDTSRSMLTEDVYPNRIEAAKRAMNSILNNLKGEKVGFIPFSESAYIQMPLTDDYSMARNFISAIDTNLISGGGTELLSGLKIAEKSFKESKSVEKIVLIISDGGEYEEETLKFAKDNNIKIFSLGIGTSDGAVIPYQDINGNNGFIKDDNGEIVVSKLNGDFLKKLSSETKGSYHEMNNLRDESKQIAENLTNMKKRESTEENLKIYKKYFQIPLGIGIILLTIGVIL